MAWTAALSTAVCACGQIESERVQFDTAGGVARGWVATVDLTTPGLEIAALVEPTERPERAVLISPEAWLGDSSIQLVVNANYFGASPDGTASIVGLCVQDGHLVSAPRSYEGQSDPALIIFESGKARVGAINADAISDASSAFAGVGGSSTSDVTGTLLVEAGENVARSARVQPLARHPRTAAGVSEDGETLVLVVIDGRQEDWSVGVTLPELADLMIEHGAWDAVNLDGGGSSAFLMRDGQGIESNRPSDGDYRPVAVSLGVRLLESELASQADRE